MYRHLAPRGDFAKAFAAAIRAFDDTVSLPLHSNWRLPQHCHCGLTYAPSPSASAQYPRYIARPLLVTSPPGWGAVETSPSPFVAAAQRDSYSSPGHQSPHPYMCTASVNRRSFAFPPLDANEALTQTVPHLNRIQGPGFIQLRVLRECAGSSGHGPESGAVSWLSRAASSRQLDCANPHRLTAMIELRMSAM